MFYGMFRAEYVAAKLLKRERNRKKMVECVVD